jgi:hypothetical protein
MSLAETIRHFARHAVASDRHARRTAAKIGDGPKWKVLVVEDPMPQRQARLRTLASRSVLPSSPVTVASCRSRSRTFRGEPAATPRFFWLNT